MRTIILLATIALTACSTSSASKLDPQPIARNLVCERVALLNPAAKCVAEFTDAGDSHIHTARVTFDAKTQDGKTVSVTKACGMTAAQLGMACGDLEAVAQQPAPQQPKQEAQPAPASSPAAEASKPAAPPKPAKK